MSSTPDETTDEALDELQNGHAETDVDEEPEPDLLHDRPPEIQHDWIPGAEMYKLHRKIKKRKKKAKKGYYQWILIDQTYPEPKFVKPKRKGGGIPEYEHDGCTYLFPPRARLPSEQQGMWTVIHRKGDAMPLNLSNPTKPSISADGLKEYLTMRVSASAPSWFDSFDIEPDDLIKYAVFALIAYAIAQQVLSGGIA